MLNQTKIILDTDIGDDIDDAFAIALGIKSKRLDFLGITTVFRNAAARAKMTRALLKSLNITEIPVFAGCDEPLVQAIEALIPNDIKTRERVDGNGKYRPPQYNESMDYEQFEKQHAVDFIIDTVNKYPNQVTVVGIGPLTNIAMAIKKDNSIVNKIKSIHIMGGYMECDSPEWNMLCDPEAAQIVFSSQIPIYLIGLDVTLKCTLDNEFKTKLQNESENVSVLLNDMMKKWANHYRFEESVLHDPLAVATVFEDFVEYKTAEIKVVLDGKERGRTIPLINGDANKAIHYAYKVKNKEFITFVKKILFSKEDEL